MVQKSADGKSHQNVKTAEANNSSLHTSGSFEGEQGVSLNVATQNTLTLCSFLFRRKMCQWKQL